MKTNKEEKLNSSKLWQLRWFYF